MCRKPLLRLVVVLALGLAVAGPVHAAGFQPRVFAAAWDWFQDLWASADHGCNIDPNGNPRCTP